MQVELNYGRASLPVALPQGALPTLIRKPAMPLLADAPAAVRAALAAPVAARPLSQEARGKQSACILVCDITRPVPNGLFLQPLIRELLAAGVPASGICVLVATGLHRPNLGKELEELIGDPWVLANVRVENHDAKDDAAHLDLGRTPHGTRVLLDRRFALAEVKIATGLVEPHFMAGWSGGRKVVAPGVAHKETITTFHSARFMGDPRAANCVLEGNPLHREQLAIAAMLGRFFALNVVIDEARRLSFVDFGEVVESHRLAVEHAARYCQVLVGKRFKTVLTSAAGYPLDKTYYQTVKGMVAPLEILEPGGALFVVSDCSEGMGSKEYVEAQRALLAQGPAGFQRGIEAKSHAAVDEWQTQKQLEALRAGEVHLFSDGLPERDRALTGVASVRGLSALTAALGERLVQCGDPSLAVIPEGPYLVPVLEQG
jgi:lactate racemase